MIKICLNTFFATLLLLMTACHGQGVHKEKEVVISNTEIAFGLPPEGQIAGYVRNIIQDKNGGFWFGTNGYGVANYDGEKVYYYALEEGFGGEQVTGISEDQEGNLWFATNLGVVKYGWSSTAKGTPKFENHFYRMHFGGQQFWSVLADSKGRVWAGEAHGVYRFDGKKWQLFDMPLLKDQTGEFITSTTSWGITEDRAGNIWITTNGHGVFRYDGEAFTRFTVKEGLAGNSVDVVRAAQDGTMWFGTRNGGVSSYDGVAFTNYTAADSLGNNEVCEIFEDNQGNIWMSSEGYGVYRFDGKRFTNFGEAEGLGVLAVQAIYEDREGRVWVGGGGGLYRFTGTGFINVTRAGPWE